MVRPYNKTKDKDRVLELLALNTPHYFAEEETPEFLDYLENKLEDYFVVESDGVTVGCGGINYFWEENLARLSWDILHPDFQGKGLGSQLARHRIAHIKKQASIKTIVVRTSQLAYHFYGKMGFELEKIEEDFWAKDFHLYQMKMEL